MSDEFNDMLWSMSSKELTRWMTARRDKTSGDFVNARAVLEAKTLVAMEATATWTKCLAIATFTLAASSVVVALFL